MKHINLVPLDLDQILILLVSEIIEVVVNKIINTSSSHSSKNESPNINGGNMHRLIQVLSHDLLAILNNLVRKIKNENVAFLFFVVFISFIIISQIIFSIVFLIISIFTIGSILSIL